MRLQDLTALARPLDLSRPSNRLPVFAGGVFLLLGTAVGLLAGALEPTAALAQGGRAAGGVVLAWALGRELDPDRPSTARYAVFAYAAVVWLGPPALVPGVALLAALRVTLRPAGPPPRALDLLGTLALAAAATWAAVVGTPVALALAAALAIDLSLPGEPGGASQAVVASLTVLVTIVLAVASGTLLGGWRPPHPGEIVALVAAAGGALRLRAGSPGTVTDDGEHRLVPVRLTRTRQLLLVAVVAAVAWAGGAGVPAMGPAVAGLAGLGTTGLRARRHRPATTVALVGRVPAALALAGLAVAAAGCTSPSDPAPGPTATPTPPPTATTGRDATGSPGSTVSPEGGGTTGPTEGGGTTGPTEAGRLDGRRALARTLTRAETRIRERDLPAASRERWARLQQAAYRRLAARPAWREPVRAALPAELREPFDRNLRATVQLRRLTDPREQLPDDWRIVAPPPAEVLLDAYRDAADTFGLDWTYLAAIHLTETRMGRIRGTSTAGARGPMQFLPSTWETYGRGDITDPHDAIAAAARYLADHGAPQDMESALYAYNPSDRYVRAISDHAAVMRADPVTYRAYHRWRVYYRLDSGDVVLPVGWPRTQASPAGNDP